MDIEKLRQGVEIQKEIEALQRDNRFYSDHISDAENYKSVRDDKVHRYFRDFLDSLENAVDILGDCLPDLVIEKAYEAIERNSKKIEELKAEFEKL